jgi:catechol 2,3-dioxygenase-like lactoylglutathione lyase family enzyme
MIGYALVGSNDLIRAKLFYDDLLTLLGATGMLEHPSGGRLYAVTGEEPMFGVLGPFNREPATFGNGAMVAFKVASPKKVAEVYGRAIALGGSDEGEPGIRGETIHGFYAAYFRDLDGNKLCVYANVFPTVSK